MAWQWRRFLAARPSQDGRAIAEHDLVKNCRAPTHWLISTQVAIIEDAEKRGELKPGMTVVEATSGNTGIAMACA